MPSCRRSPRFAADAALRRHPRAGGARAPKTCCSTGSARRWPARARGRSRPSPRFARAMGPSDGPQRGADLARARTSPLFAAMVNAAASHFAEQDDVHNGSVFHPAAVVFPAALAVAQALGRSGARAARGLRRRLRGRHPRRRIPRPLALQGVPHHRHGRHAGRRGGGRPPAGARRPSRCSMPSARPARRRRGCGSSCATRPIPSNCTPRMPRRPA